MKNNSLAYVIVALIILAGSLIVSFIYKEGKEEYNIIYTIGSTRYEAIVYTNNTIKVGYKNCFGSSCYAETKKYKYSKSKMNEFRTMINNSSASYEEYNPSREYNSIIYVIDNEKALYDTSITNNQELNIMTKKILTGEY